MSDQNKICHKRYGADAYLRNYRANSHQQEISAQPKISVHCSVCGKIFAEMHQFQAHSENGHRLECHDYMCSAMFATNQDLRRHMRVEHDVDGRMPEIKEAERMLLRRYSCTNCEKKYVLEAELKHHKKEQSTEARTGVIS